MTITNCRRVVLSPSTIPDSTYGPTYGGFATFNGLDLNVAPYTLLDDGWSSNGENLEIKLLVQTTYLTELDRYVTQLQRMLNMGTAYSQNQMGHDPLWVYTKTCDHFGAVADIGPTWLRKQVTGGSLLLQNEMVSPSGISVTVLLSLTVEAAWQRCQPLPFVYGSAVNASTDGGIAISANATVTARRYKWSSTSGLTVRHHWKYLGAYDVTFIEIGAKITAYWDDSEKKFYITDAAGTPNVVASSAQTFTTNQIVDVAFIWSPGYRMEICVDGVSVGVGAACTFADAETYTILKTGAGAHAEARNIQVWGYGFGASDIATLHSYGRPRGEVPAYKAPADENTTAQFELVSLPGHVWSPLVLAVLPTTAAVEWDMLRAAVRFGSMTLWSTMALECESGTLGSHTASTGDASASGANVARFTPANTAFGTEVTKTWISDPDDIYIQSGRWRLLLAGTDNAASVNVNQIQWRLVVQGVAGDWSDTHAFGTLATRSLLDLGTFDLPPGAWPQGTDMADASGYSGAAVAFEIQVKNTKGSGGGTLDLDALYCQPLDAEGLATAESWIAASGQYLYLDFTSQPPAAIVTWHWRTPEFASWAEWVGDELGILPSENEGTKLFLYGYRNTIETAYPLDELSIVLLMAPRYLG